MPNCAATFDVDRPLSATAIAFFILLKYGSTFHLILRRDDSDGFAAAFFFVDVCFDDDDDWVLELERDATGVRMAEPPAPALDWAAAPPLM